jgi:tetratricopeptide (TPR) repeat protein
VSVGALGLLLAGALLAGLTNAGTMSRTVERQYRAFVSLGSEPSGSGAQSRLVSGGGNRYDYWRVAVDAWQSKPLAGWGAGNYDRPYFANRATGEDIRQPHSLELQVLSELGLIGLLLLSVVGVGMTWAIAAAVRARAAPTAWTIPAAVGMLTAWVAHTSVDWLHLLPGVTAIALIAAVVLLSAETKRGQSLPTDSRPGGRHVSTAIAVATILTVAGIGLTRQGLSERYEAAAAAALRDDPERALVEADRALRLDPESVRAYHLKAASLARFGQADASRASLLEAARREPGDFVTWALLGDLATRTGDKASERYYARARRLNPREPTLAQAPK